MRGDGEGRTQANVSDSQGLQAEVVEFSFRYKDKELGAKTEPFTAEMAQRCFTILQALREQAVLAEWVDLKGPTKTGYVSSLEDDL